MPGRRDARLSRARADNKLAAQTVDHACRRIEQSVDAKGVSARPKASGSGGSLSPRVKKMLRVVKTKGLIGATLQ
jgi:hypothetical protein